jgi:predicted ATPase/DNA-binding SARP family transcriptional activator
MEFRILGGLEALEDGRQLALGSPQQRLLLGTLLLNAGRAVSVDELTDALWPERPPASADHAIEVYVSRLRKVLHANGKRRLEKESHGYVLRVDGDELDVWQFERHVERGRAALAEKQPERAADILRDALALWRGEPLAGLDCGPVARTATGRIEELRLAALEERVDADLACGRHAGLVAELEALVADEPLRERFWAQLMLALYRDGRQADALKAYQSARTILRDEVGLEPSRALQELERAILTQDTSLDAPLRASARRLALPAPVSPLIGRRTELEQLTELVRSDDVRLVTITGTGGIGKTRLALETARRLEDDFGEHVFFVDLAAIRRSDLVVTAIATALGVEEQPGTSLLETLATSLSDRPSVVLLDNFEHVLDAAPVVSELLAGAEALTVLATSRSRLHLYGEHEYQVSPLAVPSVGERSLDALSACEAIELFVACARRRIPEFTVGPENALSVAEICIRLDGIPLAIELAASQSNALQPTALLEALDSRLPVLVNGPRDAPERQKSLRATIDWSHDLLDADERRLFRNLSVFTAGCTLDACFAVCGATSATVESLVEKNLVVREVGVDQRISLLETIREYALERLRDAAALEELSLRHAEYFAGLAELAEPELRGPAQLEWLARLDSEQANIWAAMAWALDAERFDVPLRLGSALWRYWEGRGSITEARRRLDEVLARSARQAVDARAAALFASGRMALRQGDLEHARAVFAEGRALFDAAGRPGGVALCTAGLGWIAHVVGPLDDAVALCRDAVVVARASGETWILADALNNLGVALRSIGDLAGSRLALGESLAIRREIGDLEGVTAALNGLALIAVAEDDFDEADKLFGQAFVVSEQRGDLFYAAAKNVVLAYLAFGRGHFGQATSLSVRALEACRRHGYQQFAAYALETLAGVAAAEGRLRQAARVLGAAVVISEAIGRGRARRSDGVAYDWEARAVKRVLEQARRDFGHEAWDAAVREGRQLEVAEALASAAEWTTAHERASRSFEDAPTAPSRH